MPSKKTAAKKTAPVPPNLEDLGKPATIDDAPPSRRPSVRELADRAALRLLRLRGASLASVQQAQALNSFDTHADGAAWAYSEGIDAIALERHAQRAEAQAEASGPVRPSKKGGRK